MLPSGWGGTEAGLRPPGPRRRSADCAPRSLGLLLQRSLRLLQGLLSLLQRLLDLERSVRLRLHDRLPLRGLRLRLCLLRLLEVRRGLLGLLRLDLRLLLGLLSLLRLLLCELCLLLRLLLCLLGLLGLCLCDLRLLLCLLLGLLSLLL